MKKIIVLFVVLLGSAACSIRELPPDAAGVIILRNGNLEKTTSFALLDTVYVQIAPLLAPSTPHTITLRASDGKTVISQIRVKTDKNGGIAPTPIWYDVGLVTRGEDRGTVNPDRLEINAFEVNVKGGGTNLTLPFFLFFTHGVVNGQSRASLPPAPTVWAAGADGKLRNSFQEDDDARASSTRDDEVYIGGHGFDPAKILVHAYVVADRNWSDRESIAPYVKVGPIHIGVNADGTLDSSALVWDIDTSNFGENGAFDLLIDSDKDGRYDAPRDSDRPFGEWDSPGPDAVDNPSVPGFIVVRNPGFPLGQTQPTVAAELDDDGDGLPNAQETLHGCNPSKADSDADGLPDTREISLGTHCDKNDSDGDALPDGLEVATGTNPIEKDTDNDGLSDGVEDANKNGQVDIGETDPRLADSDKGGVSDGAEAEDGTDPLVASDDGWKDSDFDGLADSEEEQLGTSPVRPDSDDDGLNDFAELRVHFTLPMDADTDNDDLTDGLEINEHGTSPFLADTDGGGTPDGMEVALHLTDPLSPGDDFAGDPDGDSLTTAAEIENGTNPLAADTDGDGLRDNAEITGGTNPNLPDHDADGLLDGEEDHNGNGVQDAGETDPKDADSDNDNVNDGDELHATNGHPEVTNPLEPDTDGDASNDDVDPDPATSDLSDADSDGLTLGEERRWGSNPALADTDGDGLSDGAEVNTHATSPIRADTDGDGLSDSQEINTHATLPLERDTDADGLIDGVEINTTFTNPLVADSDGDGLLDGAEDVDGDGVLAASETDPRDPDTDDGGTLDGQELIAGTNPTQGHGDDDLFREDANINIASTGIFSFESGQWGYADIFNANGNDTLSNEFVTYGIKAIWNPWVPPLHLAWDPDRPVRNAEANGRLPEGFGDLSNAIADVYIVAFPQDADGNPAADISSMYGRTLEDISGSVERIPIQASCYNGALQQNIWEPPFPRGDYIVVVDLDLDGVYTKGVDLIDARRINRQDAFAAGFSVVGNDGSNGNSNGIQNNGNGNNGN